jgi:murein DD-endopeptidase MepM/ murein hydrolase activator NlpD
LAQTVLLAAGKGYIWARPHGSVDAPALPGPAPVATQGRFWPVTADRIVTSPFGPRWGTIHTGVDFGFNGGAGDRPVFAVQSGTVIFSGAAAGYGGPDPCGWLVIDSDDSQGGGVWEYGHIVREHALTVGAKVQAGQQIGVINPNEGTNGGVAAHLHLSYMPRGYDPGAKVDPLPVLDGSREPGVHEPAPPPPPPPPPPAPEPSLAPGTPLTGRPWHHSVTEDDHGLLLNIRAEGLLTQRLVFELCQRAGVDARALYEETRNSF